LHGFEAKMLFITLVRISYLPSKHQKFKNNAKVIRAFLENLENENNRHLLKYAHSWCLYVGQPTCPH